MNVCEFFPKLWPFTFFIPPVYFFWGSNTKIMRGLWCKRVNTRAVFYENRWYVKKLSWGRQQIDRQTYRARQTDRQKNAEQVTSELKLRTHIARSIKNYLDLYLERYKIPTFARSDWVERPIKSSFLNVIQVFTGPLIRFCFSRS